MRTIVVRVGTWVACASVTVLLSMAVFVLGLWVNPRPPGVVAGEDDCLAVAPVHLVDELVVHLRGEAAKLLGEPLGEAGDGLTRVLVVGGEVGDFGGVEDRRAGVAPDGERVVAGLEQNGGAARREVVATCLRDEPQGFRDSGVLHGWISFGWGLGVS